MWSWRTEQKLDEPPGRYVLLHGQSVEGMVNITPEISRQSWFMDRICELLNSGDHS